MPNLLGVHATDKYFVGTNFRKLQTNGKYSENLTHTKINKPMVVLGIALVAHI